MKREIAVFLIITMVLSLSACGKTLKGTDGLIEKAREEIENNLLENKIIEIIDCYDIEDCKYGIKDILDKHDKILNTSGEKNKEEYITTIKVAN